MSSVPVKYARHNVKRTRKKSKKSLLSASVINDEREQIGLYPAPTSSRLASGSSNGNGSASGNTSSSSSSTSTGSPTTGHQPPYDLRRKLSLLEGGSGNVSATSGAALYNNAAAPSAAAATPASTPANANAPAVVALGMVPAAAPAVINPATAMVAAMPCLAGCSSSVAAVGFSSSVAFPASLLLPRKRQRRAGCGASLSCTEGSNSAANYLLYELPDEVLLTIFSYLLEQDLCRVAQVCKRFHDISSDTELWKILYQSVYEKNMDKIHTLADCFAIKPTTKTYLKRHKGFTQL